VVLETVRVPGAGSWECLTRRGLRGALQ
jgi:hypothetical protein